MSGKPTGKPRRMGSSRKERHGLGRMRGNEDMETMEEEPRAVVDRKDVGNRQEEDSSHKSSDIRDPYREPRPSHELHCNTPENAGLDSAPLSVTTEAQSIPISAHSVEQSVTTEETNITTLSQAEPPTNEDSRTVYLTAVTNPVVPELVSIPEPNKMERRRKMGSSRRSSQHTNVQRHGRIEWDVTHIEEENLGGEKTEKEVTQTPGKLLEEKVTELVTGRAEGYHDGGIKDSQEHMEKNEDVIKDMDIQEGNDRERASPAKDKDIQHIKEETPLKDAEIHETKQESAGAEPEPQICDNVMQDISKEGLLKDEETYELKEEEGLVEDNGTQKLNEENPVEENEIQALEEQGPKSDDETQIIVEINREQSDQFVKRNTANVDISNQDVLENEETTKVIPEMEEKKREDAQVMQKVLDEEVSVMLFDDQTESMKHDQSVLDSFSVESYGTEEDKFSEKESRSQVMVHQIQDETLMVLPELKISPLSELNVAQNLELTCTPGHILDDLHFQSTHSERPSAGYETKSSTCQPPYTENFQMEDRQMTPGKRRKMGSTRRNVGRRLGDETKECSHEVAAQHQGDEGSMKEEIRSDDPSEGACVEAAMELCREEVQLENQLEKKEDSNNKSRMTHEREGMQEEGMDVGLETSMNTLLENFGIQATQLSFCEDRDLKKWQEDEKRKHFEVTDRENADTKNKREAERAMEKKEDVEKERVEENVKIGMGKEVASSEYGQNLVEKVKDADEKCFGEEESVSVFLELPRYPTTENNKDIDDNWFNTCQGLTRNSAAAESSTSNLSLPQSSQHLQDSSPSEARPIEKRKKMGSSRKGVRERHKEQETEEKRAQAAEETTVKEEGSDELDKMTEVLMLAKEEQTDQGTTDKGNTTENLTGSGSSIPGAMTSVLSSTLAKQPEDPNIQVTPQPAARRKKMGSRRKGQTNLGKEEREQEWTQDGEDAEITAVLQRILEVFRYSSLKDKQFITLEDMQALSSELGPDVEELQQVFKQLDQNLSGLMTPQDFTTGLQDIIKSKPASLNPVHQAHMSVVQGEVTSRPRQCFQPDMEHPGGHSCLQDPADPPGPLGHGILGWTASGWSSLSIDENPLEGPVTLSQSSHHWQEGHALWERKADHTSSAETGSLSKHQETRGKNGVEHLRGEVGVLNTNQEERREEEQMREGVGLLSKDQQNVQQKVEEHLDEDPLTLGRQHGGLTQLWSKGKRVERGENDSDSENEKGYLAEDCKKGTQGEKEDWDENLVEGGEWREEQPLIKEEGINEGFWKKERDEKMMLEEEKREVWGVQGGEGREEKVIKGRETNEEWMEKTMEGKEREELVVRGDAKKEQVVGGGEEEGEQIVKEERREEQVVKGSDKMEEQVVEGGKKKEKEYEKQLVKGGLEGTVEKEEQLVQMGKETPEQIVGKDEEKWDQWVKVGEDWQEQIVDGGKEKEKVVEGEEDRREQVIEGDEAMKEQVEGKNEEKEEELVEGGMEDKEQMVKGTKEKEEQVVSGAEREEWKMEGGKEKDGEVVQGEEDKKEQVLEGPYANDKQLGERGEEGEQVIEKNEKKKEHVIEGGKESKEKFVVVEEGEDEKEQIVKEIEEMEEHVVEGGEEREQRNVNGTEVQDEDIVEGRKKRKKHKREKRRMLKVEGAENKGKLAVERDNENEEQMVEKEKEQKVEGNEEWKEQDKDGGDKSNKQVVKEMKELLVVEEAVKGEEEKEDQLVEESEEENQVVEGEEQKEEQVVEEPDTNDEQVMEHDEEKEKQLVEEGEEEEKHVVKEAEKEKQVLGAIEETEEQFMEGIVEEKEQVKEGYKEKEEQLVEGIEDKKIHIVKEAEMEEQVIQRSEDKEQQYVERDAEKVEQVEERLQSEDLKVEGGDEREEQGMKVSEEKEQILMEEGMEDAEQAMEEGERTEDQLVERSEEEEEERGVEEDKEMNEQIIQREEKEEQEPHANDEQAMEGSEEKEKQLFKGGEEEEHAMKTKKEEQVIEGIEEKEQKFVEGSEEKKKHVFEGTGEKEQLLVEGGVKNVKQVMVGDEKKEDQLEEGSDEEKEQDVEELDVNDECIMGGNEEMKEQLVEGDEQEEKHVVNEEAEKEELVVERVERKELKLEGGKETDKQIVEGEEQKEDQVVVEQLDVNEKQVIGDGEEMEEQLLEGGEEEEKHVKIAEKEQQIMGGAEEKEKLVVERVERKELKLEGGKETDKQIAKGEEEKEDQVVEEPDANNEQVMEGDEEKEKQMVEGGKKEKNQVAGESEEKMEQVMEKDEKKGKQIVEGMDTNDEQVVQHDEDKEEGLVEEGEEKEIHRVKETKEEGILKVNEATEEYVEGGKEKDNQLLELSKEDKKQVVQEDEEKEEWVVERGEDIKKELMEGSEEKEQFEYPCQTMETDKKKNPQTDSQWLHAHEACTWELQQSQMVHLRDTLEDLSKIMTYEQEGNPHLSTSSAEAHEWVWDSELLENQLSYRVEEEEMQRWDVWAETEDDAQEWSTKRDRIKQEEEMDEMDVVFWGGWKEQSSQKEVSHFLANDLYPILEENETESEMREGSQEGDQDASHRQLKTDQHNFHSSFDIDDSGKEFALLKLESSGSTVTKTLEELELKDQVQSMENNKDESRSTDQKGVEKSVESEGEERMQTKDNREGEEKFVKATEQGGAKVGAAEKQQGDQPKSERSEGGLQANREQERTTKESEEMIEIIYSELEEEDSQENMERDEEEKTFTKTGAVDWVAEKYLKEEKNTDRAFEKKELIATLEVDIIEPAKAEQEVRAEQGIPQELNRYERYSIEEFDKGQISKKEGETGRQKRSTVEVLIKQCEEEEKLALGESRLNDISEENQQRKAEIKELDHEAVSVKKGQENTFQKIISIEAQNLPLVRHLNITSTKESRREDWSEEKFNLKEIPIDRKMKLVWDMESKDEECRETDKERKGMGSGAGIDVGSEEAQEIHKISAEYGGTNEEEVMSVSNGEEEGDPGYSVEYGETVKMDKMHVGYEETEGKVETIKVYGETEEEGMGVGSGEQEGEPGNGVECRNGENVEEMGVGFKETAKEVGTIEGYGETEEEGMGMGYREQEGEPGNGVECRKGEDVEEMGVGSKETEEEVGTIEGYGETEEEGMGMGYREQEGEPGNGVECRKGQDIEEMEVGSKETEEEVGTIKVYGETEEEGMGVESGEQEGEPGNGVECRKGEDVEEMGVGSKETEEEVGTIEGYGETKEKEEFGDDGVAEQVDWMSKVNPSECILFKGVTEVPGESRETSDGSCVQNALGATEELTVIEVQDQESFAFKPVVGSYGDITVGHNAENMTVYKNGRTGENHQTGQHWGEEIPCSEPAVNEKKRKGKEATGVEVKDHCPAENKDSSKTTFSEIQGTVLKVKRDDLENELASDHKRHKVCDTNSQVEKQVVEHEAMVAVKVTTVTRVDETFSSEPQKHGLAEHQITGEDKMGQEGEKLVKVVSRVKETSEKVHEDEELREAAMQIYEEIEQEIRQEFIGVSEAQQREGEEETRWGLGATGERVSVALHDDGQRAFGCLPAGKWTPPTSGPDILYNVVLVGNSSVGKTSFMKCFQSGEMTLDHCATIGLDSCIQAIMLNDQRVLLQLWDTAGQERYHSITKQILRKAQGLLLMYDITSSESFHGIRYWMSCIEEGSPDNAVMMLLGNKNDSPKREVPCDEGQRLAAEFSIPFMECSAASGDNVIRSMETLARMLKQRLDEKDEPPLMLHKEQPKKRFGCC